MGSFNGCHRIEGLPWVIVHLYVDRWNVQFVIEPQIGLEHVLQLGLELADVFVHVIGIFIYFPEL